jgi:hypothetical protein
MHHWAHAGRRDCDPWWENETPWHREWKALYPEGCREVSHLAPDGEIHRADVKTPTGIVIEFQHSGMTDAERLARESFYGNLVWVVDGSPFKDNFDIGHLLPDPASEMARDLIWMKAARDAEGASEGMFFRLSECLPGLTTATRRSLQHDALYPVHGMHEIEDEVNSAYRGHHQYHWVRPRRTWLDATKPVYIDLGDGQLARLETYDETGLLCIRRVDKRKFVHDTMTEASGSAIATRFYPLPASRDKR